MMSDTISPLLQWLNTHPNLAGFVAFIISAAESIAIIGTIIPGTVTMAAVGTLMGAGVIPFWSTLIWAIFGAILGDNLSFWTGYYFKDRLHVVWPFKRYPNLLISGENFFHRHGSKSILIGRFIGPVRALVPLVAGMLRMKPLRFILASIMASALWAPVYMFPGVLLGAATLELPPDIAAHMMLKLLLIGFFILLVIWVTYRLLILVSWQTNRCLNSIWLRLGRSRYLHGITQILKHHDEAYTHGQLTLAVYIIIIGAIFFYLGFYLLHNNPAYIGINMAFFHLFRSLRTPGIDDVMIYISLLGDMKVLIPVIAITCGWLAWRKHWHTAIHVLALMLLIISGAFIFKHVTHIARPWGIRVTFDTFSFPSGHAMLSIAVYVGLGMLLIHLANIKRTKLIYFFIAVLVLLIGISRMYLGAHWFTDVLGGWLAGAAILLAVIVSYNRKPREPVNALSLFIIIFIALIGTASGIYQHNLIKYRYIYAQRDWPTVTISVSDWWEQKVQNLPIYRVGRVGIPIEVLNLQWVGNLDEINNVLVAQGWEVPAETDWTDILHRISDISSSDHLPISSPLYLDKKPVLVLTKKIDNDKKLVVMRLWTSHIILKDSSQPLWIGTVNTIPRTYSWLITYKRSNVFNINSAVLFNRIPAQYDVKSFDIGTEFKNHPRIQQVLLIKPKSIS